MFDPQKLIEYAEERAAETKRHRDGLNLIRQGEILSARNSAHGYQLDNEKLTEAVVELSKRLLALEEWRNSLPPVMAFPGEFK